jgi:chemotaxis protein histidine kinase CheA
VRRSDKRGARPNAAGATATNGKSAAAAPTVRKSAAKPRAKAKPRATATAKAAPKATPRAARPARAATAAADAAATSSGPRRTIPPAGYASPTSHADADESSASADLIGTAVQAAGELAQIGIAVGRQALQSMIDRLPKP